MSVPLISTRWEKSNFVRARFSTTLSGFILDFGADQNSRMSYCTVISICWRLRQNRIHDNSLLPVKNKVQRHWKFVSWGAMLLAKICIGNCSGNYSCQIARIFSGRRLNFLQFQGHPKEYFGKISVRMKGCLNISKPFSQHCPRLLKSFVGKSLFPWDF